MWLEIIKAMVFGLIQGITEWLPISSTGHMILFNQFFPLEPASFFDVFKVVIQFGSILAVLVLFWHKLNPWSPTKTPKQKRSTWKLWFLVVIGCIPAGILGLLLDDFIDEKLSAPFVVAVALIVYGVIFVLTARHPVKPRIKKLGRLSVKDAFVIGCFQCLALIPGTSRSGATILGGMYEGCSRTVASEYSFFIAVPIMAAASLLKVVKFLLAGTGFTGPQIILLTTGTVTAFLVSLVAIKALLSYVRKHTFEVFGWYRIILGVLVIFFFYII